MGGVDVTVSVMSEEERERHLAEARDFIDFRCDVWDDAALERITKARCVLGMVFEPGLDKGGSAKSFVDELARRAAAMVFSPDAVLRDADGRVLSSLRQAPGAEGPMDGDAGAPDDAPEDDAEPPDAGRRPRGAARLGAPLALLARVRGAGRRPYPPPRRRSPRSAAARAERPARRTRACGARLVSAPPGSWSDRDVVDHGWGAEAVVVLAWALGLAELPPHDAQVDPRELGDQIGLFAEAPAGLVRDRLRSAEELEWMRKRLLAIHWRFREHQVAPGPKDFTQFERGTWWMRDVDLSGIRLAGQVLAVDGLPVSTADPAAVQRASSIAMERHRAINWLCGDHPFWSEVDVST